MPTKSNEKPSAIGKYKENMILLDKIGMQESKDRNMQRQISIYIFENDYSENFVNFLGTQAAKSLQFY